MCSLKSIWKVSFKALLIAVFCLVATDVAEAKTITSSNSFIDSNSLNYFQNIYEREEYKYSILASEYVQYTGSYNSTTYYYLCLTDSAVDVSNTSNVSATCNKLYQYYRLNNVYEVEQLNDNNLTIQNTLYYFQDNKYYYNYTYIYIICIIVTTLFVYILLKDLFRS